MSSLLDAWKRLFDRPTATPSEQIQDIRAWQKTLLQEHEGLRNEMDLLLRTYVRTLDRFVEHASELSVEQLQQEQESIESIRTILLNAIRRLEVSCKDHRELMDEWHEWVAFRRAAGERHVLEPAHKLRVELIRSELAIRGFELEDPTSAKKNQASIQPLQSDDSREVLREPFVPEQVRAEQPLDDLSDWMDLRRIQVEPEYLAAEQAWHEIKERAHKHPEHALAVLKRLKEAHADLRLFDRANHQTRNRLAVFSL